ncbi:MAG: proline/glycine betaine ABC transporter permease [SAR324 cluster bacterium]|jgi:glycine betaine/proline transport system permease protein|nr:proline/glycine betaine ABC transporter permease [SAR324 cluster bacterium]MDP6744768.1 proline/glycine betaine ABC transporter permease [SAR324 cluster bacterium]
MKTNWKYWVPICFFAFWGLIVISYRYAKPRYKPDNLEDLLNDFSWLINWPKWLDFPLMQPLNAGFDWLIVQYGLFFEGINNFLLGIYTVMKDAVVGLPWPLVVALVIIFTYFISGKKMSTTILVGFCTFFIGFLSPRYWDKSIMTTCIVIIGIFLCLIIGIPIGIAMARKPKLRKAILPILDLMQTIPSFCYLIPGILLFGLGAVPAIIAIFVYAAPPLIRLTDLGIRLVDEEVVEAADAFGASKKQKLWGVQIPLALPNIMQGVNQSVMMALAMVVIASMIGTRGIGDEVLLGLQQLNVGMATEAGIAIVLLAIIFDRVTQAYGDKIQDKTKPKKVKSAK